MNNFYSLAYQRGEILFDYSELINVNKPLQQISFAIQQSCDSEQKSQKIFIVIGLTDKSIRIAFFSIFTTNISIRTGLKLTKKKMEVLVNWNSHVRRGRWPWVSPSCDHRITNLKSWLSNILSHEFTTPPTKCTFIHTTLNCTHIMLLLTENSHTEWLTCYTLKVHLQ